MKLVDVLAALRRLWIVTVVCLLLTAGLAFAAARVVAQRYTATAHFLFLPPSSSIAPDANPYMQLGGLYQAVEMVGVALSDQATMAEVKSISAKAEVSVRQDPLSSAPLLLITVVDTNEQRTLQILDMMLTKVPRRLDDLQASINVKSTNRVTSMVLTEDKEAKPTGFDQLRAVIVAAAAGLVFTVMFIAILDGVLARRRERRSGTELADPDMKELITLRSTPAAPADDLKTSELGTRPRRAQAPRRKIRVGPAGRHGIRPTERRSRP